MNDFYLNKKNNLINFIVFFLYKIILDIVYFFFIVDFFAYEGFSANFNIARLILSYIFVLLLYISLTKSTKNISQIIIWILNLLSFIPMTTYYAFTDVSSQFMFSVALFWIFINLALNKLPNLMVNIKISSYDAKRIFNLIVMILGLYVLFVLYLNFGIKINFNLAKVYSFRKEYNNIKYPLFNYFTDWVAYIINPILLSIFIIKRDFLKALFILLSQLYLFFTVGMKTFLFAPVFVLCLMWVIMRKNPYVFIMSGLIGSILVGIFSNLFLNDIWLLSLFTRRVLFIPAKLNFIYYDYFSKNGIVYLSHSIFKGIINYPYELNPVNLIGYIYFNNPNMSANTGIIGDAYMNFGYIGLILWGILLIVVLKLVDSCAKGLDRRIGIAAMAMPIIALINSALLTSLLTHGILFSIFILYILPRNNKVTTQILK
jgi:hypothetical protein